jgi:uncharacterized UBP type Zn finger protein
MDIGVFTSSQFTCEFCGKNHKGAHCSFDVANDVTMGEVLKIIKHDRDFELVAQWHANTIANLRPLESPDFEVVNLTSGGSGAAMHSKQSGNGISIYDCLSWFSTEETLTGNDKWYCGRCKNHVTALKKMELYRAPEYLIIHLKRFSHQRQSFFSSKKISELVNFPVEGLDLSDYVLHNTQQQKKGSSDQLIYDLYAVSNHFGSLNGGHYTAYAQNPIDKRWYDFDDTDVSRMDPAGAVTKAAYVLFYRRR